MHFVPSLSCEMRKGFSTGALPGGLPASHSGSDFLPRILAWKVCHFPGLNSENGTILNGDFSTVGVLNPKTLNPRPLSGTYNKAFSVLMSILGSLNVWKLPEAHS